MIDPPPIAPLVIENGEGHRATQKNELIVVQGFLFQAIAELGTSLNGRVDTLGQEMTRRFERLDDLRERDADMLEAKVNRTAEVLAEKVLETNRAQQANCAVLMAPYASVGQVLGAAAWISGHPKFALAILGVLMVAFFIAAALIGGVMMPGR